MQSLPDTSNDPLWDEYGHLLLPRQCVSELVEKRNQALRAFRLKAEEVDSAKAKPQDESPKWKSCVEDWNGPILRLLDSAATDQAVSTYEATLPTAESKRRATVILEQLRERGEYRKLTTVPTAWRHDLRLLEGTFPNFAEVIDYFRVAFAYAEHSGSILHFPPLLLAGPPGCGKSMFAQSLAQRFNAGFDCLRMETEQSNSSLSGSADYWNNTKPGRVFRFLMQEDVANPIFLLDEIDKIGQIEYDPMTSLYSLLEPSSARTFSDQSCPWVQLDASRIIWICTANDASSLPAPIRDRLRIFQVRNPTPQQLRIMIKRTFKKVCTELSLVGRSLQLSEEAVDAVASLSLRQIHRVLREGVGRVLYRGGKRVMASDIAIEQGSQEKLRSIGFL